MKTTIALLSMVVATLAFPAGQYRKQITDNSKTATIVQQDYINGGNGYNFAYETSDGVSRQEQAELKNPGTKDESIVVQGSYTYVGEDGNTYTVTYIADENGYRPTDHEVVTAKNLQYFVTKNTLRFFEITGISSDFLHKNVKLWTEDETYESSKRMVLSMKVTNDIAERGVALMEEYNGLHTTKNNNSTCCY